MTLTLLLMLCGRTPLYLTAIVGSCASVLIDGLASSGTAQTSLARLVSSGVQPVIADIAGVLVLIGVMEASGLLGVVVNEIVRLSRCIGGGPGVAVAGGIAAGCIGSMTGFTQPSVVGAASGNAAVQLGLTPDQSAAVLGHAGHLGNLAGITHPTQVAIISVSGVGYGLFNLYSTIIALCVFVASFIRLRSALRMQTKPTDPDDAMSTIPEPEQRPFTASKLLAFLPCRADLAIHSGMPDFSCRHRRCDIRRPVRRPKAKTGRIRDDRRG